MANHLMPSARAVADLRFVAVACLFLTLLASPPSRAAKAPLSAAELRDEATHIVTGTVVEVTSKTRKSEVVKGFGIHRDRVFTIRIRVTRSSKGEGIKAGDEIEVRAWQPSRRVPAVAGLQGHTPIPRAGDKVTVHLLGGEGRPLEPILPNGIAIDDEAKQGGGTDGERSR